jgi:hypothetical protein
MPLKLKPGDPFPDLSLPDESGTLRSLSSLADGQLLFVSLFRGPW